MRNVDLHAVEAGPLRTHGRIDEEALDLVDILDGHAVGLDDLASAVGKVAVEATEGELRDDGHALGMHRLDQPRILRDQRFVVQAHHAAEVAVVSRHAGKTRDDGSNAAACELVVDAVCCLVDAAIGCGDALPGCGAHQTVRQIEAAHLDRFEYLPCHRPFLPLPVCKVKSRIRAEIC